MSQITVPQSEAFINYVFAGGIAPNTPCPINFPFFALTDIAVTYIAHLDGSTGSLAYGTQFTASGVAADDGFSSGAATILISMGACTITVARQTPIEKLSNWPTSGAFSIYAENTLWSKHTAWHQQHFRDTKRSIRAPMGEILADMPAKVTRANKLLAFDANGNPSATGTNADQIIADMTALAEAAAASAAAADISEANAASSASSAATSATSANNAAISAAASASAASTSAGTASTAATSAQNAATAAATSAAQALISETNALAAATSVGKPATEVIMGIAEIATQGETDAGIDDERIVTPKKMVAYLTSHLGPGGLIPNASESTSGIVMLANNADVDAGTDNTKAVTPLKLRRLIASQAQVNAGTEDTLYITSKKLHDFTGTIVGPMQIGQNTGDGQLKINAAATGYSTADFYEAGSVRWQIGRDPSSRFYISRFDPAGTWVDIPLIIESATGNATFFKPVSIGGTPTAALPACMLAVVSNADSPRLRIDSQRVGDYAVLHLRTTSREHQIFSAPDGSLTLYDRTASLNRMVIDTTGTVLIPGHVYSPTLAVDGSFYMAMLGGTRPVVNFAANCYILGDRTSNNWMKFSAEGAERLWLGSFGAAFVGNVSIGDSFAGGAFSLDIVRSGVDVVARACASTAGKFAEFRMQNTDRTYGLRVISSPTVGALEFIDYTASRRDAYFDTAGTFVTCGAIYAYNDGNFGFRFDGNAKYVHFAPGTFLNWNPTDNKIYVYKNSVKVQEW